MKRSKKTKRAARTVQAAIVASALSLSAFSVSAHRAKGDYLTGDFHQHTLYTDGSDPFAKVMAANDAYGLDWWANSEHGGRRNRDGEGISWLDTEKYPVKARSWSSRSRHTILATPIVAH